MTRNGWDTPRSWWDTPAGQVTTFLIAIIAIAVVVAFLVGLGFEAWKWLGHTQK